MAGFDFGGVLQLALLLLASTASRCLNIPPQHIAQLLRPSYDFVVVGGGAAGLTIANRLTEHPNAGPLDPAPEEDNILIPGLIGQGLVGSFNWNFSTTAQEFLDNQTRPFVSGHVVGGGTVLNGMVWTRGPREDYDAWEALGNPHWNWDSLLPYFRKIESFSGNVSNAVRDGLGVQPDLSVHGSRGPIEVSYPRFIYNQTQGFLQGVQHLGVSPNGDPNDGSGSGAMVIPSSMTARCQTRSDARIGYLDSAIHRPNLHVAAGQMVARLLLAETEEPSPAMGLGNPVQVTHKAIGVEFGKLGERQRRRVKCNNEVILAAGAIYSPVLLQVSGIGPQRVLENLNVTVAIDLPGVGNNLQDHGMIPVDYTYKQPGLFTSASIGANQSLHDAILAQFRLNHTGIGAYTSPLVSTVAFTPLSALPGGDAVLRNLNSSQPIGDAVPTDIDMTVRNGYIAQRRLQHSRLLSDRFAAVVEVMATSTGLLQLAFQRPLSRGSVRPSSADVLTGGPPLIDPRYCADVLDCELLVAAVRFTDRLSRSQSMAELQPSAPDPPLSGPELEDNAAVLERVRELVTTEFHPVGTTAMMPLELGGVVDPRLKVWGTANVRVVDAGIMPLLPAAHIQAAVYAVAEKAAILIKADNRIGEL